MRHLLRAFVAVGVATAIAVLGLSPAEAYYREVSDPAGDLRVQGPCDGVTGAKALDIRKLSATTYKSGGWRMRATLRVSRLPKPRRHQFQTFSWTASFGGESRFVITATRSTYRGTTSIRAEARSAGADPATPGTSVKVKVKGRTITVRGLELEAGQRLRVSGSTSFQKVSARGDRTCSVTDGTRRSAPLRTSS